MFKAKAWVTSIVKLFVLVRVFLITLPSIAYGAESGDTSRWMEKLNPELKLREIIIPATHNSACNYYQDISPIEQLKKGIRCFDICPGYINDSFTLDHVTKDKDGPGFYAMAMGGGMFPSASITRVLEAVYDFVQDKKEIVILNFTHTDNSYMYAAQDCKSWLIDQIVNKFGDLIAKSYLDLTLGELRQQNKKIIVSCEGSDFWPPIQSHFNEGKESTDDLCKELEKQIHDAKSASLFVLQAFHHSFFFASKSKELRDSYHTALGMEVNTLKTNAETMNKKIEDFLPKKWKKANIIAIDCFDKDSKLVPLCIAINQAKRPSHKKRGWF